MRLQNAPLWAHPNVEQLSPTVHEACNVPRFHVHACRPFALASKSKKRHGSYHYSLCSREGGLVGSSEQLSDNYIGMKATARFEPRDSLV